MKKFFLEHKWITALLINVVLAALMLLLGDMEYETNDDFSIGNQIAEGNFYVGFVNYYLCVFIHFIQGLIPAVNAFNAVQIAFSFAALTCLTFVIIDHDRSFWFSILFLPLLVIFGVDHYITLQFTKTAAMLILSGGMMLFHYTVWKRRVPGVIAGAVMIFVGCMYRFSNIMAILGFAAVLILAFLLEQLAASRSAGRKSTLARRVQKVEFKNMLMRGAAFVLVIVIVGCAGYGLNKLSKAKNTSTPELKSYREYNKYRAKFSDYPKPAYDQNKEFYDKLGISDNDLNALKNGMYDFDGAASLKNLKAIYELARKSDNRRGKEEILKSAREIVSKAIREKNKRLYHAIIFLAMFVGGLILARNRWLIYPVMLALGAAAAYVYLLYYGRTVYRATYIIEISALVMTFYSFRYAEPRAYVIGLMRRNGAAALKAAAAAITVAGIVLITAAIPSWAPDQKSGDCDGDALFDYMRSHPDKTFIMDPSTSIHFFRCNLSYYKDPLKRQPSLTNMMSMGGWSTKSPRHTEKLKQNGLDNVYRDIINNDDVIIVCNYYVVSNGRRVIKGIFTKYLDEHYAPEGTFVWAFPYKKIGGIQTWKVVTLPEEEGASATYYGDE
ncbi:MAG: hypothetical protein ACOX41_02795 [Anaerovoracaceae bacterium]|jgi:hypothetical protein